MFLPPNLYDMYAWLWFVPGLINLILASVFGLTVLLAADQSTAQVYVAPPLEYAIFIIVGLFPLLMAPLLCKVKIDVIEPEQMPCHPLHFGHLSIVSGVVFIVTLVVCIAIYLTTKAATDPILPYIGNFSLQSTTLYVISLGLGFIAACVFMTVIGFAAYVWKQSNSWANQVGIVLVSLIGATSSTTILLYAILPDNGSESHFVIAAIAFVTGDCYMSFVPCLLDKSFYDLYQEMWFFPGVFATVCTALIGAGLQWTDSSSNYQIYLTRVLQYVLFLTPTILSAMLHPLMSRIAIVSDVYCPLSTS
jgi:hypothetical protein